MSRAYALLAGAFERALDPQNLTAPAILSLIARDAAHVLEQDELASHAMGALGLTKGIPPSVSGISRFLFRLLGVAGPVRDAARASLAKVSSRLATSRRRVFEETAPLLLEFLSILDADGGSAAVSDFIEQLKVGASERGGQDALKETFRAWFECQQAGAPAVRAQLMLLGNSQLLLYEQSCLERHLRQSLEMPIEQIFELELGQATGVWKRRVLTPLLRWVTRDFAKALGAFWKSTAARFAMKLSVPASYQLGLGNQGPKRPSLFPLDLSEFTEPRLLAISQRFDANYGLTHGSSRNDWTDLRDRMGYLIESFRERQQDDSLAQRSDPGDGPKQATLV
jgi:hypothetical protein